MKDAIFPKMTIAIDGGAYEPGAIVTHGTERHLQQLIDQIEKDPDQRIQWILFHFKTSNFQRKSYFTSASVKEKTITKSKKNIQSCWLPRIGYGSVWLPLFCLIHRVNVFIGYSTHIPFVLSLTPINTISVLHDVGFIDYPEKYQCVKKMRGIFFNALKRANTFVCFSSFIQERLKTFTKKTVLLVRPGIDHIKKLTPNNRKRKSQYIIHVGRLAESKDIDVLLDIYRKYTQKNKRVDLLLVGKNDGVYLNRKSVRIAQYVTDEELAEYYHNALFMIHTSLTEGLCFPVLEGLSFGLAVYVADERLYREYKPFFKNLYRVTDLIKHNKTNAKIINTNQKIYSWKRYYNEIKHVCLR